MLTVNAIDGWFHRNSKGIFGDDYAHARMRRKKCNVECYTLQESLGNNDNDNNENKNNNNTQCQRLLDRNHSFYIFQY
eukprot:scaffold2065_cov107-Cylindrotheca_fusiformis.AAC.6